MLKVSFVLKQHTYCPPCCSPKKSQPRYTYRRYAYTKKSVCEKLIFYKKMIKTKHQSKLHIAQFCTSFAWTCPKFHNLVVIVSGKFQYNKYICTNHSIMLHMVL